MLFINVFETTVCVVPCHEWRYRFSVETSSVVDVVLASHYTMLGATSYWSSVDLRPFLAHAKAPLN